MKKRKALVVVDMQNDFITGVLRNEASQEILPAVRAKIQEYRDNGGFILFIRDTHGVNYLDTLEGKKFSIPHCVVNTSGWQIADGLRNDDEYTLGTETIGNLTIADKLRIYIAQDTRPEGDYSDYIESVELVGLWTDTSVISNALILKAQLPEIEIYVDASCCAGVMPESHKAALTVMRRCQVNVINFDEI